MEKEFALLGFGEAGSAFARKGGWSMHVRPYDLKLEAESTRAAMIGHCRAAKVVPCLSVRDAVAGAPLILSLVTADQAVAAARSATAHLAPGALYCDLNSVAPQTKREIAAFVHAAGGHYVDVAVMAPVDPLGMAVPLLLSGPDAAGAQGALCRLGFSNVTIVGDQVGKASSIKMIRSVMVKGIEALTAECVLAADRAGVLADVLASLDASEKSRPWAARADYNLDRMMVHGLRRAAEMEEVVKTLDGLGTGSAMTRGTMERQRAIGALGLRDPAPGLADKLHQLNEQKAQAA